MRNPFRYVALRKESVDRNGAVTVPGAQHQQSLSARRAWIEIGAYAADPSGKMQSLSARRAWIEITPNWARTKSRTWVALRKESVDRNIKKAEWDTFGNRRSPQGERG